jgi:hypothetical protein
LLSAIERKGELARCCDKQERDREVFSGFDPEISPFREDHARPKSLGDQSVQSETIVRQEESDPGTRPRNSTQEFDPGT